MSKIVVATYKYDPMYDVENNLLSSHTLVFWKEGTNTVTPLPAVMVFRDSGGNVIQENVMATIDT